MYEIAPPQQPAVDPSKTSEPALQAQAAFAARLQARQAMAEELMQRNDLAAAMVQWKILYALAPGNAEFRRQLKATQTLIRQRVNTHMQLGEQAFKKGDFQQATREFLRVLALDPQQSQPQIYLRQIEQHQPKNTRRVQSTGPAPAKKN
jgi:hypothetical protein